MGSMSDPAGSIAARPIFLQDAGPNKIMVIKVIREHVGCGLADAKAFVDRAPCPLVEWSNAERLNAFRQALVDAGATVT